MPRLAIALALLLLAFHATLLAQSTPAELPNLLAFEQARLDHQRTAMYTLGGWAVLNIGAGLALRANTEGVDRRFHEMNAIWNVVNLGIAGIGYLGVVREDPAAATLFGATADHYSFQKVLLFNAGLDVGYVLGGLYLTERARRPDVDADLLRGYGRSIMLQGAFLFAFDLVNYFISAGRDGQLELLISGGGVGLGYRF